MECEKLLEIARELEQIAKERPDNFLDDLKFRALREKFKTQYIAVERRDGRLLRAMLRHSRAGPLPTIADNKRFGVRP